MILAGTGDNGGDALYAGERLARRGAAVTAIQAGPRLHAGGAAALRAAAAGSSPSRPPRGPDDTRPDNARPTWPLATTPGGTCGTRSGTRT